jgi:acyl-CoA thioester hydrolase
MNDHKKIITDTPVRFRDIDSMGHVNNAVYFTYFEEGRKAFVREVFGIVSPSDYNFILAHISCDFLKAITISDDVCLEIWVGEIGRKRFDFIYRLVKKSATVDNPVVYATGRSVQVFFDYQKNTTLTIPEAVREKISEYASGELKPNV